MKISKALKLLKQYKTPENVVNHCKKVAFIAKKIAEAYNEKGFDLNIELIESSALLHDILRVNNATHAEDGAKLLNKLGYAKEANLVKKHKFTGILSKGYELHTLEEKIINYADKRVKEDKIVSMKQRFDSWKEYHDNKSEALIKAFSQLEKELFIPLALNPEDIK